jgi:hypothetical protein
VARVRHFLKRLAGRVLMKATYWTAIGTLLIPIGVLIVVEKPEWSDFVRWLIVLGLASFATGWYYTVKEEQRQDAIEKRRQAEEERRQREDKRRQAEHEETLRGAKATFILLTHMALNQGVDVSKLIEDEKKHL